MCVVSSVGNHQPHGPLLRPNPFNQNPCQKKTCLIVSQPAHSLNYVFYWLLVVVSFNTLLVRMWSFFSGENMTSKKRFCTGPSLWNSLRMPTPSPVFSGDANLLYLDLSGSGSCVSLFMVQGMRIPSSYTITFMLFRNSLNLSQLLDI